MSSHHIVRENQEPALLIQDFQALRSDELGQLLEWSPTVIVDAYNLDFLVSEEIKVDFIFCSESLDLRQEHTRILPVEAGSFIHSALTHLVAQSYSAVNILCSDIDPLLVGFASDINIVAFCKRKKYVFVKEYYEKWKPKGEKIYLESNSIATRHGLVPLEDNVFETQKDGFFQLTFNSSDFVCIGEDL